MILCNFFFCISLILFLITIGNLFIHFVFLLIPQPVLPLLNHTIKKKGEQGTLKKKGIRDHN
ncbi:hypothetical protein BDV25DRAFT_163107 [Aspergillus avenaceus]|uniref:Uncharacterized protein n=1 Tax=Aspergillus avenaceus TaxID=36643 RepID=A0A5N6TIG1_ASPAV|nr:hypothetical protein BDV25DRAFT_163107 [Aspergillus avenaceus]